MPRGQIFVSYASERREQAEPIALALRSRGYDVFFDRDDLPPGDSYHDQIAAAIDRADIMLFALSPESVDKGRYTVSEIGLARKKWKTPKGRVLPVMVTPTPMEEIPAYLKEVSVLDTQGNLVADTALRVDEMFETIRKAEGARTLGAALKVAAAVAILAAVGFLGWRYLVAPPEPVVTAEQGEGPAAEPAAPAVPEPEGVRTVRTPVLGIQIVQDGETAPVYVADRNGVTDRVIVQLRRAPFDVRLPASLWAAPDAENPALAVAMSADEAIFGQAALDAEVGETPYLGSGSGMADSEFGSGLLFSADSEYPDCCWGHNLIAGGRFNASGEGYRGFYVSTLQNKVTQENMLGAAPSIYLVFYLNREDPAAWTDWEAPDTLRYNELERVELRFID